MKYKVLKKIRLSTLLNFIFLFLSILDPTRSIFHATEVVMLLFFLWNIKKIDFEYLPAIFFCIGIWFLSLGFAITNQTFDKSREISLLTSYIFLFYLLYQKNASNKTFYSFYIIGKLMSLIVITLGVLFLLFPSVGEIAIAFFSSDNSTIMFSSARRVLFITVISVFYKTSPMIVLLLAYSTAKFFATKKKNYFFDSLLFFINLFFSATRANILSAILIIGIVFLAYLFYIKKAKNIFPFFLLAIFIAATALVLMLLMQKGEASLNTKKLHQQSILQLLFSNPLRSIFVGYGPGSLFWTAGWRNYTAQTELSYLELIRNYGLIGGCGIICVFLSPFIVMLHNRELSSYYKVSFSIGYLAYLFIAGTNPFLNCATGYLTLSLFFYMAYNNILKEV